VQGSGVKRDAAKSLKGPPMYAAHLIEDRPGEFRVWSEEAERKGPELPYVGPVARVHGDNNWVYVITDDYEGVAMINRETLPKLIEALQRLETHLSQPSN
jgi:hypothetical protein